MSIILWCPSSHETSGERFSTVPGTKNNWWSWFSCLKRRCTGTFELPGLNLFYRAQKASGHSKRMQTSYRFCATSESCEGTWGAWECPMTLKPYSWLTDSNPRSVIGRFDTYCTPKLKWFNLDMECIQSIQVQQGNTYQHNRGTFWCKSKLDLMYVRRENT